MTGAPSRSWGRSDCDTGGRIGASYAKAGKEMAQYLTKELGK